MSRRGTLLVLSAPSGTGKSDHREGTAGRGRRAVLFGVRHDPASARREADGVDYHFMSRPDFERSVGEGGFLEYAEVHGNLYGTPRDTTERELAAGRDLLLDIDVQGARQVQASGITAHSVFVLPPSRAELERRLRGRGTETEEQTRERLRNAAEELGQAGEFDHLVLNDELAEAVKAVRAIIRAVRTSRSAMEPVLARLRAEFAAGGS